MFKKFLLKIFSLNFTTEMFINNGFLYNREKEELIRSCNKGGITFGPYKHHEAIDIGITLILNEDLFILLRLEEFLEDN